MNTNEIKQPLVHSVKLRFCEFANDGSLLVGAPQLYAYGDGEELADRCSVCRTGMSNLRGLSGLNRQVDAVRNPNGVGGTATSLIRIGGRVVLANRGLTPRGYMLLPPCG